MYHNYFRQTKGKYGCRKSTFALTFLYETKKVQSAAKEASAPWIGFRNF